MSDNLLPLYTFFEALGFHPFHAFGIAGTGTLAVASGCDTLVRRYEWQNSDAAGTASIEQAIVSAEAKLRDYLGFSVAPRYTSETVPWPCTENASWRWQSVQLSEGEIRAVGVEALTAISTAAAVAYSDSDGDTIDDTFTVTAATTVTDTSQIAVYFSVADRFNGWGSTTAIGSRWRLLPVQVSITGGVVTVRGPKQLCVRPILYEGVTNIGANGLEPGTAGNFVTTLDIYQRATETNNTSVETSQAVITWETRPCHGWWCCCDCCSNTANPFGGSPFDPAAVAQAVARVGIRNAVNGIVTPFEALLNTTTNVWSTDTVTVCDWPDRVTVRTLSGYPLGSDGQMQEPFRTAVARLAAAELARPVCGCESANRELARWQFDLARSGGASDEVYGAVSASDLDNPLGTRRGHVHAWRLIRQRLHVRGFLA